MKHFLIAITISLSCTTIFAQGNFNTTIVSNDINTIIADAAKGFPSTQNSVIEEDRYGISFSVNNAVLGLKNTASLYYQKPSEASKYSDGIPEKFGFYQSFKKDSKEYAFILDSLEKILDVTAKKSGLNKKLIKQDKENKKLYKTYEYQVSGKSVFGITYSLSTGNISLSIFSPYRPGSVKTHLKTLGCVVFSYSGFYKVYAVPVYGESPSDIGNISELVERAFSSSGLVDKNYIHSWMPGKRVDQVQQQLGKSVVVGEVGGIQAK